MRKDGVRTVRRAHIANPGDRRSHAAGRAKEALKYSKEKVYQGRPTSGMVQNSPS
jgi:hypothetical protein